MDTNSAIVGSGTFIGNDISNSENGIVLSDGASVVRDNYIHDLGDNFGDPHLDGIAVQGGQNHVLIEHNTVEAWDTSCIFIKNDFGPINDITVRNNLLYGDPERRDPASTIYVYGPNTTNVSITNNYVEKGIWLNTIATSNANPTIAGNIEWNNKTDPIPYPNSPPATGSVSINDVTISEGNSGTKVATFTVTRSGGTAAFDVNYATSSNGTATVADGDYVAASNTLHFGANQNTQTISIAINGDTKVEANETFNVVLSNATNGATISDSQGIGTITNDDTAPPPPPPPSSNTVTSATLINADTDTDIRAIMNGDTFDFSLLGTENLNIRANTGAGTESVRFFLDGVLFRQENANPFALAGDGPGGDYLAWTPSVGAHTLTITPFSADSGGGQVGTSLTVNFTVKAALQQGPLVATLINADTNGDIERLDNGDVLNFSQYGTSNLNVRADILFLIQCRVLNLTSTAPTPKSRASRPTRLPGTVPAAITSLGHLRQARTL